MLISTSATVVLPALLAVHGRISVAVAQPLWVARVKPAVMHTSHTTARTCRATMHADPGGGDHQPHRSTVSDGSAGSEAARFPTRDTPSADVLAAQLDALGAGDIPRTYRLFSRARRLSLQDGSRIDMRASTKLERVYVFLAQILARDCPGLLFHESWEIVASLGDPDPPRGRLPTWSYRVKLWLEDGSARHFIFGLTRQSEADLNGDPRDVDGFERCWFVWQITADDDHRDDDDDDDAPSPSPTKPSGRKRSGPLVMMAGAAAEEDEPSCDSEVLDPSYFSDILYEGDAHVPWDLFGRPQPPVRNAANDGAFGPPGTQILDCGCGAGDNANFLGAKGYVVLGFDFSASAVATAKRRAAAEGTAEAIASGGGAVDFVEASAVDLGSASDMERRAREIGGFPVALDSALLHCLDDDSQRAYLDGLRPLMRPGGKLFVGCFSDRNPDPWSNPRRISQSLLRERFSEERGWAIEDISEAWYERPRERSASSGGAWTMAWWAVVTASPDDSASE
jgi:SAM-dependent methyltransferase